MNYKFMIYGIKFFSQIPQCEVLAMGDSRADVIGALNGQRINPGDFYSIALVDDQDNAIPMIWTMEGFRSVRQ